jgi:hypothetical protein
MDRRQNLKLYEPPEEPAIDGDSFEQCGQWVGLLVAIGLVSGVIGVFAWLTN